VGQCRSGKTRPFLGCRLCHQLAPIGPPVGPERTKKSFVPTCLPGRLANVHSFFLLLRAVGNLRPCLSALQSYHPTQDCPVTLSSGLPLVLGASPTYSGWFSHPSRLSSALLGPRQAAPAKIEAGNRSYKLVEHGIDARPCTTRGRVDLHRPGALRKTAWRCKGACDRFTCCSPEAP
jgi:hypothetical protein